MNHVPSVLEQHLRFDMSLNVRDWQIMVPISGRNMHRCTACFVGLVFMPCFVWLVFEYACIMYLYKVESVIAILCAVLTESPPKLHTIAG